MAAAAPGKRRSPAPRSLLVQQTSSGPASPSPDVVTTRLYDVSDLVALLVESESKKAA
jgi:hypothetical protein